MHDLFLLGVTPEDTLHSAVHLALTVANVFFVASYYLALGGSVLVSLQRSVPVGLGSRGTRSENVCPYWSFMALWIFHL